MKVGHSTLAPLLRNSAQGDVLAQTLLHPGREFSLSDLRRLTGHGLSMVHKEVNLLVDGGVLLDRRAGRTRQVSANLDYPLIGPLTTIVEATYGPLPVISEELTGLAGIEAVYIYGSWAARRAGESGPLPRDIDVLVVGNVNRRELAAAAQQATTRLLTEVNARPVSSQAWSSAEDPFIKTIQLRPMVQLDPKDLMPND
jgi:predicted nucleotidyltransferase